MKSEDTDKEYLADFPNGPLDTYRKCASFNWKVMKLLIEDEEHLQFKMKVWKVMEDDPLFHHSPFTLPVDEQHRITTLRCKKIYSHNLVSQEEILTNPAKNTMLIIALGEYDMNLCLKYFVPHSFFVRSIEDLGTKKHLHFIKSAQEEEITGCYALTEVAHGTNVKDMKTTATFDPKQQEFVLHSENFEAGKCWIGSLGKTSTHAVVFAQLITPDGTSHGLHAFLTPLRDPKTMLLYPGVIVGDLGEKVGLNGIDNGFAIFTNYRIPKDNLLDRTGSVTPDGKYVSPFKDARKKFGASLSTLIVGRIGIVLISAHNLGKAIVIAIRYSAIRRQFGPTDGEELPIIEYQLQQWRLFPYLAACYTLKVFATASMQNLIQLRIASYFEEDKSKVAAFRMELHALQSSAKGLTTWTAQHGIQECREACGGHGYLKCSGFGELRNNNDANCTYEGDNNVLCQQTSNWLLQLWADRNKTEFKLISPLGSVDFLCNPKKIGSQKFTAANTQEISNPEAILEAYESLLLWLLENTSDLYKRQCKLNDPFTARNNSQVYSARTLSMAYIERFVIKEFWNFCNSVNSTGGEKDVLLRLCSLYGLWCLEKHLATLYECGYAEGPLPSRLIREGIVQMCQQLKPDAVALVDAIAPPDFILNSTIGKSDGKLYENLESSFFQNPGAIERPTWWKDIVGKFKAKL